MNKHNCIKCKGAYHDDDTDDYLCEPCLAERKRVASEIDAKFAGRVKETPIRGVDEYDRAIEQARARGMRFPSPSDLGL